MGASCYHVSSAPNKGRRAPFYCQVQGGPEHQAGLAVISSSQEMDMLRRLFLTKTALINASLSGYTNFYRGAPASLGPEDCVTVDVTRTHQWRVVDCQREAFVLCETPLVAGLQQPELAAVSPDQLSCPLTYTLMGTTCFHVSPDPHGGTYAPHYCPTASGELAAIESEAMMTLLANSMLKTSVYISVNLSESGYTNFHEGEAEKVSSGGFQAGVDDLFERRNKRRCVLADAALGFQWTNTSCSGSFPVLCQTPAQVDTAKEHQPCEKDEHVYARFTCFWVLERLQHTHTEATALCRSRGMALAEVNSEAENDFLQSFVPHFSWIGLNDIETEGDFKWSDGHAPVFQRWHAGQPNGGRAQNCVIYSPKHSSPGYWHDWDCDEKCGVVCRGPTLDVRRQREGRG